MTWTSPPLLSMAPEWIAALQILDCWNHKSASVGNTMKPSWTCRNCNSKELCDSPHHRKQLPTLSLSYSCNWLDIYTCTDREFESMLKVKGASETFTDIWPVAGYPSTFVPQPSLTLDVLSWKETKNKTKKCLKKKKILPPNNQNAIICTKIDAAGGWRSGCVSVGWRFLGGRRLGFGGRRCGGARLRGNLRLLYFVHVLRLCGLCRWANKPGSDREGNVWASW